MAAGNPPREVAQRIDPKRLIQLQRYHAPPESSWIPDEERQGDDEGDDRRISKEATDLTAIQGPQQQQERGRQGEEEVLLERDERAVPPPHGAARSARDEHDQGE